MRLIDKFAKSIKILNDYRNKYHAEPSGTEEYEVAYAINDILPNFCNLIENIDEQPSVDAEPVIRCKDCVYWKTMTKKR